MPLKKITQESTKNLCCQCNTSKQAGNQLSLSRALLAVILILISNGVFSQTQDTLLSSSRLKKLSLEELMNVEVTSVSKHPEKLNEAASAIQVITQNDIRNSGAKTLAEALKLAANLQVAQVNSSQWAISARGFDNVLANKLLVMVDGRVVYTPLYAGVFWDVQNVMLEDVDRIEVISGPGGTMWGENAVNGVINIITKSSKDTKGLFVEGAAGNNLPGLGSIRYGGKINDNLTYRVYGTGFDMGTSAPISNVNTKDDEWPMYQGGFRMDWDASKKDNVALMANVYYGKPNPNAIDTPVVTRGNNIEARWTHKISEKSDYQLQAYYDETYRNLGGGLIEELKTYDLDWQNKFGLGQRNIVTYGADLRLMDDHVTNLELIGFFPGHKTLYLYSAFVQDEFILIKNHLLFTAGVKSEHNSYTGLEYQPNGRLSWMPSKSETIWAAVSRAVRTPSRIDRDFAEYITLSLPPLLEGSSDFISETLIAYELGWRLEPLKNLSLSLATFYNVYDNIRSAEPGPPPFFIPIILGNDVQGNTYGAELSATYQLTSWWKFRGGYTYLRKNLSVKPGTVDLNDATAESDDPQNQFLIQSYADLPCGLELGAVVRYVDKLPNPYVSSYTGLDLRIGWKVTKAVELSMVGQNLQNKSHLEFIPASPAPRDIQRWIYGKITFRL